MANYKTVKQDALDKVYRDAFTVQYLETALWSSNDESTPEGGEPMDKNYSIEDMHNSVLLWALRECSEFFEANSEWIDSENFTGQGDAYEQAAHDFWLTRNGHGAGFWDGDWTEPAATKLTDASKAFGECSLYIGDDGKIYHFDG